jgi:hypothetical protein
VPAYAPGTIVRLNTGQRAAVCHAFADDPCRPNVLILGDNEDQSAPTPTIADTRPAAARRSQPGRPTRRGAPAGIREAGDIPKEGSRVDLKGRANLWITHAQDSSVEVDNFYPAYPGEFDLMLGSANPIERSAPASPNQRPEADAA